MEKSVTLPTIQRHGGGASDKKGEGNIAPIPNSAAGMAEKGVY
jgi:hypothetical protein